MSKQARPIQQLENEWSHQRDSLKYRCVCQYLALIRERLGMPDGDSRRVPTGIEAQSVMKSLDPQWTAIVQRIATPLGITDVETIRYLFTSFFGNDTTQGRIERVVSFNIPRHVVLEDELREKFNLDFVAVAPRQVGKRPVSMAHPAKHEPFEGKDETLQLATSYVIDVALRSRKGLGFSGGHDMMDLAVSLEREHEKSQHKSPRHAPGSKLYALAGDQDPTSVQCSANSVIARIARVFEGDVEETQSFLCCPMAGSDVASANRLYEASEHLRRNRDAIRQHVQFAFTGVGSRFEHDLPVGEAGQTSKTPRPNWSLELFRAKLVFERLVGAVLNELDRIAQETSCPDIDSLRAHVLTVRFDDVQDKVDAWIESAESAAPDEFKKLFQKLLPNSITAPPSGTSNASPNDAANKVRESVGKKQAELRNVEPIDATEVGEVKGDILYRAVPLRVRPNTIDARFWGVAKADLLGGDGAGGDARNTKRVVAVAWDIDKAYAVFEVLKSGMLNAVITSEAMAVELLKLKRSGQNGDLASQSESQPTTPADGDLSTRVKEFENWQDQFIIRTKVVAEYLSLLARSGEEKEADCIQKLRDELVHELRARLTGKDDIGLGDADLVMHLMEVVRGIAASMGADVPTEAQQGNAPVYGRESRFTSRDRRTLKRDFFALVPRHTALEQTLKTVYGENGNGASIGFVGVAVTDVSARDREPRDLSQSRQDAVANLAKQYLLFVVGRCAALGSQNSRLSIGFSGGRSIIQLAAELSFERGVYPSWEDAVQFGQSPLFINLAKNGIEAYSLAPDLIPGSIAHSANTVVGLIARTLGISGSSFYGMPITVPEPDVAALKDEIESTPFFTTSCLRALGVRFAFTGIGATGKDSALSKLREFMELPQDCLPDPKLAGDVLYTPFTREGEEAAGQDNMQKRIIGLDLDEIKWMSGGKEPGSSRWSPNRKALRRPDRVIAIAWGDDKVEAIHAALKHHVVNGLITDEWTATRLIEKAAAEGTRRLA